MGRNDNGWIVLTRAIQKHWIWQDGNGFQIWIWLLMSANYGKSKIFWKGKERILERGQLLTTIREIAASCYCSKGKVERTLERLRIGTMIETEIGTHGSIVTICNYNKYQDIPKEIGTEIGTHFGTQTGHKRDTNGTIITIKQRNKETKNNYMPSAFASGLAIRWLAFALKELPHNVSRWKEVDFAKALDKILKTGISEPQLESVFEFIQNDEFWRKNAVSPVGLSKISKNGCRKIDNILSKMPKKDTFWSDIESAYEEKGMAAFSEGTKYGN